MVRGLCQGLCPAGWMVRGLCRAYGAGVGSEVLQRSAAGLQGVVLLAGAQQLQVGLQGPGVDQPARPRRVLFLH